MANHIPYGYRIENGVAVIDEGQAEQVRTLFSGYLSGLALVPAAEAAGLTLFHSGAKRILQNEHYLGDDFYPAIIDSETFSKVAESPCRSIRQNPGADNTAALRSRDRLYYRKGHTQIR